MPSSLLSATTSQSRKPRESFDFDNDVTTASVTPTNSFLNQVNPKYVVSLESLKLGRVIGRGAFGTVQVAEWSQSEKSIVAVKRISWDDGTDNMETRKRQALREINMLCNLHSPNIVTFFGVCKTPGSLLLVQELCTGGNLRSVMKRRQEFLSHYKIVFMSQIASAMEYLHSKGVIHRDLKPENVLLGGHSSNVCKLCDFGLARPNDALDQIATMTIGTGTGECQSDYTAYNCRNQHATCYFLYYFSAFYMAPEILKEANGQSSTIETDGSKCDVFSAAILYVEMLRPNSDLYGDEPTMMVAYKVDF
jgi:serine/threonine protein kinase